MRTKTYLYTRGAVRAVFWTGVAVLGAVLIEAMIQGYFRLIALVGGAL